MREIDTIDKGANARLHWMRSLPQRVRWVPHGTVPTLDGVPPISAEPLTTGSLPLNFERGAEKLATRTLGHNRKQKKCNAAVDDEPPFCASIIVGG